MVGGKIQPKNPQITDKTGEYFFMVPKGRYYLEIIKENYYSQKTGEFEVIDEIVNINVEIKEKDEWLKKIDWNIIVLIGAVFLIIIARKLLA